MKQYFVRFYRANETMVDERLNYVVHAHSKSSYDKILFHRILKMFVIADQTSQTSVSKMRLYFHDGSFVEYEDVS